MSNYEQKLVSMGLVLPQPLKLPSHMTLPFPWVNVRGDRAYISGHGPQNPDGSPAGPFGAVGDNVSVEDAHASARKAALAVLGSLKRELGSLDRITGWCRVFGMVNCAPRFANPPAVINGFTELIIEVFGHEVGNHARSAIGVAGLPLNFPVEIEAEVMISG
ncbi:RidA family protein [Rhizobium sp. 18055]|jgi:enamine deaminase RidA (YjgF/YER057c/UK114 family)|uniref:RidA family protein n=1 Tax=Rhizobium sp. 18055 TaxID=2681403 RepID=UPI0013585F2A|nr:RidA family protein [Rhizobium sp. 18055]